MKKLPSKIAVPESAAEITAEVRKLLSAAGARDVLPTPREGILACAQLIEAGELDLAEYRESLSTKLASFFHRALAKVAGLLDFSSRLVYVDPSASRPRRNFIAFHEVTHRVLPWQRLMYTEDDNDTLNESCRTKFEAEANYGAADILFQCDKFEKEAKDYDLLIPGVLELADRYEASVHATLRRFVERNHRPCTLLVLKPTCVEHEGGGNSFYVVYSVASTSFSTQFCFPESQFIEPTDALGQLLNDGTEGEITILDFTGTSRTCTVDSFDNRRHVLVLVCPQR